MIIPTKDRITIYTRLFEDGVMVARKDYNGKVSRCSFGVVDATLRLTVLFLAPLPGHEEHLGLARHEIARVARTRQAPVQLAVELLHAHQ